MVAARNARLEISGKKKGASKSWRPCRLLELRGA
jgi:hypothetical protein